VGLTRDTIINNINANDILICFVYSNSLASTAARMHIISPTRTTSFRIVPARQTNAAINIELYTTWKSAGSKWGERNPAENNVIVERPSIMDG
jgi:hypothetical protein